MSHDQVLNVRPVKTRIFRADENLRNFVIEHISPSLIHEEMVLAVTSKIVSLSENRLLATTSVTKAALVEQESDHYLGDIGYGCHLTIKHGLFIPSAGIDESNSEGGHYILYPEDPFASARKLWSDLREAWGLKHLGILLTDSHTTPLRRGVTGISLAHWGFKGLKDLVGSPDLFGRELKMTTVNVADGLATAATLMMGEAAEARPLAVLSGTGAEFSDQTDPHEVSIPLEDDLYYPVFRHLIRPKQS